MLDHAGHWPHSPPMWLLGLLCLVGAAVLPLLSLGLVPNRQAASSYWLGYVLGMVTLILLYAAGQLGAFR